MGTAGGPSPRGGAGAEPDASVGREDVQNGGLSRGVRGHGNGFGGESLNGGTRRRKWAVLVLRRKLYEPVMGGAQRLCDYSFMNFYLNLDYALFAESAKYRHGDCYHNYERSHSDLKYRRALYRLDLVLAALVARLCFCFPFGRLYKAQQLFMYVLFTDNGVCKTSS